MVTPSWLQVGPDHKREETRLTAVLEGFGTWDETFSFPLLSRHTAECALLYVEARSATRVVAARAYPLRRLRRGVGVLQLYDPDVSAGPAAAAGTLV